MNMFWKKQNGPDADRENKEEKITEKAFSRSLLASALGILLCIAALCSVTYAWFSESISSSSNTLTAGTFDLVITAQTASDTVEITAHTNGSKSCTLPAGTYTVTLAMTEESNVKGYCIVELGGARYVTSPISRDSAIGAPNLTFTVTVAEGEAVTVVFSPRWGYPAEPNLRDGGEVNVPAASVPSE